MSAARIAMVVFVVMWALFTSASARAGSVPDTWSGIITLDWSSQLPENSPLRAEVDRIIINAHTEWTMSVHFKKVSASDRGVEYTVQSATVDYLHVRRHDARGRRGDASMHTLQTERLEASGRTLDSRACNLVLWVNYAAKRYWIEVGGFRLEDVPRSGQVLIEVGTRRVSVPATGHHDVIVPVRFEGRYTGGDPEILEGTYDANVEPPPGVDLSYETVGGMVEWSLFRGACPDVMEACVKNAEEALSPCLFIQGVHQLDCGDRGRVETDCFGLELLGLDGQPQPRSPEYARDCVEDACSFSEGDPGTEADLEAAIDDLMDCWNEYSKTSSDCNDLCP